MKLVSMAMDKNCYVRKAISDELEKSTGSICLYQYANVWLGNESVMDPQYCSELVDVSLLEAEIGFFSIYLLRNGRTDDGRTDGGQRDRQKKLSTVERDQ